MNTCSIYMTNMPVYQCVSASPHGLTQVSMIPLCEHVHHPLLFFFFFPSGVKDAVVTSQKSWFLVLNPLNLTTLDTLN